MSGVLGGLIGMIVVAVGVYLHMPKGADQQAGVVERIAGDEPSPKASPSPSPSVPPTPFSVMRFVPRAQKGMIPSQAAETFTIRTREDESGFDPEAIDVEAGEIIMIQFENHSAQQWHSWALVTPGSELEVEAAARREGPENGYIPVLPDKIIAHSQVIGPGDSESVIFKVPSRPGAYPFISTVPGDGTRLRGLLRVK